MSNNISDMISVFASGAPVSGTLVDAIDWDETVTVGNAAGLVIAARYGRLTIMAKEDEVIVRVLPTAADASARIRQSLESAREITTMVRALTGRLGTVPVYAGTPVAPEVAPVTVPAGWGSV